MLFTVLPPLVIGIFDQFVSARVLDRYPQLYILGQQNFFFTKTAFWQWVVNAFYHSIVLFAFSIVLFWGDLKQATGLDCGLWFWGTTLYLSTLLTVLGKAALVSAYVSFLPSRLLILIYIFSPRQYLDEVYGGRSVKAEIVLVTLKLTLHTSFYSYSGLFRLYNAFSTVICRRRTSYRIFKRI